MYRNKVTIDVIRKVELQLSYNKDFTITWLKDFVPCV